MTLNRNVFLILFSRSLRTFPYGFLSVVLPVYLASIGSSLVVGSFFSVSVSSSIVFLAVLSIFGNRFKMKTILIYQMFLFAATMAILSFTDFAPFLLVGAAIAMTNWAPGGGSGTGAGPYNTTINLLLSEHSDSKSRTLALSLSSVTGTVSFALGAYFLSFINLPTKPTFVLPSISSFDWNAPYALFIFAALLQLVALVCVIPVPKPDNTASGSSAILTGFQRSRYLSLMKMAGGFVSAEFSSGFANGLFLRFMPLWFYLKFSIDLATLGEIFALAGVITAFTILLSPKLERTLGAINSIYYGRIVYAFMIVTMAFTPSFILALLIYYVSLIFSRVAAPIQQSFVFEKIEKEHWTEVTGMIGVANSMGGAISPVIGAFLLLDVNQTFPFILAFPFIIASAAIYKFAFRKSDKPKSALSAS